MSTYTDAVNAGLAGFEFVSPGLAPTCWTCRRAHDCGTAQQLADAIMSAKAINEPLFSSIPRGCCGSHLAGDRYAAHGFLGSEPDRGALVHLEICQDCLFYLANGDEP